jgi:hypothetical protein
LFLVLPTLPRPFRLRPQPWNTSRVRRVAHLLHSAPVVGNRDPRSPNLTHRLMRERLRRTLRESYEVLPVRRGVCCLARLLTLVVRGVAVGSLAGCLALLLHVTAKRFLGLLKHSGPGWNNRAGKSDLQKVSPNSLPRITLSQIQPRHQQERITCLESL